MQAVNSTDARTALVEYLARSATTNSGAPDTARGPLRRVGRRVLGPGLRFRVRRALTHLVTRRERRKASRLARAGSVRVHLASGLEHKPGWVNVDLFGHPVDVAWDLSRRLPLPDSSVDAIFNEHFLGYLTVEQALHMLEECHRLLRPGGVLRSGVPDCGRPEVAWPGTPTRLLGLQLYFVSDPSSRTMFDDATLRLVTEAAGFRDVEARRHGDSAIAPCPDTEARAVGTLYVEGTK